MNQVLPKADHLIQFRLGPGNQVKQLLLHDAVELARSIYPETRPGRSPETIERIRSHMLKRWHDPAAAERQRQSIQEGTSSPELRAVRSTNARAQWADPEKRQRLLTARARRVV